MENLTCPRCGAEMVTRTLAGSAGEGDVSQCPEGHGVFLSRADLGSLIEAENDWHRNATQQTAPIPKITQFRTTPTRRRITEAKIARLGTPPLAVRAKAEDT